MFLIQTFGRGHVLTPDITIVYIMKHLVFNFVVNSFIPQHSMEGFTKFISPFLNAFRNRYQIYLRSAQFISKILYSRILFGYWSHVFLYAYTWFILLLICNFQCSYSSLSFLRVYSMYPLSWVITTWVWSPDHRLHLYYWRL